MSKDFFHSFYSVLDSNGIHLFSSSDYITSLKLAQKGLFQIGGPFLLALGVISCSVNIDVFIQKNFRKNPCSIYLISYNIAGLFIIIKRNIFSWLWY
jgi:hypothetical protein